MKHFILSVDEINKLQMENEAYKQSEQEATEIIAELKHTLDCKNGTIETLKAENDRLKKDKIGLHSEIKQLEQENERLKEENYGLNQELLGYKKGVQAKEIEKLKHSEYPYDNIDCEWCVEECE